MPAQLAAGCGVRITTAYNSLRHRMVGWGRLSGVLPDGDANGIVVEMCGEVLHVA